MDQDTDVVLQPNFARRLWIAGQWMLVVISGLFLMVLAFPGESIDAPGAPISSYYVGVVVFAVAVAVLAPPIFFRLPKSGKWLAFAGLIVTSLFVANRLGAIHDAYERTPEGAKIAAQRAAEKRAEEADQAKRDEAESLIAGARAQADKLEEVLEKQQACLSWGKQLTELNDRVQETLNDPASFEHVSTEFIVPTDEGYNVAMTFRAKNSFNATITARVLADLDPESCNIGRFSEPS